MIIKDMNIEELKNKATTEHIPILLEDGIVFIQKYIKSHRCKNILEFGTAVGYSSICFASVDPSVSVDTYEIDQQRFDQANENIQLLGLSQQIHTHLQDGKEATFDKKYDLVFVDAAKSQYKLYMEHALPYLSDDGVFIFDNLNFHGLVDHPENTNNRNTKSLVKKIKIFRDWLLETSDYDVIFYKNIADGIAIAKRRSKS